MITVVGGNKGGQGKLPLHQTWLLLSQIKEGSLPVKRRSTTNSRKTSCRTRAAGLLPAITLVEKFDNLTQTYRL